MKYATLKIKYIRGNQCPFINKNLSKETMNSSRLRNTYVSTKKGIDRKCYNKQRNFVASLLRNEIKGTFIIIFILKFN